MGVMTLEHCAVCSVGQRPSLLGLGESVDLDHLVPIPVLCMGCGTSACSLSLSLSLSFHIYKMGMTIVPIS